MTEIIVRKTEMKAVILTLFGLLLHAFVSPAYGAGGNILWEYDDAQAAKQEALASVVDSAGNTIIVGYTQNASEDFYTAKILADGATTSWTATFDLAGGSDRAAAVTVDQNNDVLVSGYAWNGTNYDFHTIKYSSSDGSVLWQNTFNGDADGPDIVTAIAIDSLDNVYVGGYSQGATGNDDFMLIKYSPDGANPDGTPIWQSSHNSGVDNEDRINDIAVGIDGVAVTGFSHNGSDFDYLTIKYGFDGTQTWLKVASGSGDDRAMATALDGSGNVLVTGYIYNGTDDDIYTIKYRFDDGTYLWSKSYLGAYGDQGKDLFIDGAGNVYMAGSTYTLTGFTDFYTAKYAAADGALAWEKTYNSSGSNTDIPTEITVDNAGEVFVVGYTTKVSADDDILVIKYKKDNGTELWATSFDGAAGKNERSVGIGTDATGHVLVGGWSDQWTASATDYDFYTIKYDAGLLNAPTGLNTTVVSDTAVDLSWTDNAANEDGFKIWRKLGELGSWSEIDTAAANAISYSDSSLTAHVWYYYKVQAYNASEGNSQFTNEAPVLTTMVSYLAPAWTYIYDNVDGGDDYAYGVAVGPDNHPVITGSSLTAENGTYPSQDYHTVKLDRADASELWSVGYNDVDDEMDIASGVVVDSNNDVIVSGSSSLYGGGAGNTNDVYTIKYASTGPPEFGSPHIWFDQYNGPAGDDDRSESIDEALDGSNSTVVTGYGKNASLNDDIYVVKYLADGTRQWAATPFNGASDNNDYPAAVVFDSSGDVIVTGKTHNGTDYDIFTRKLNGANGATVWTKIHDSTNGWDEGRDVAVDSNGDVYVAGVVVNGSTNDDLYLVKYNGTNGALLWEKIIDGPANGNDIGESVRIDTILNEVVVGGTVFAGVGNDDFYLARYKADGTFVWEQQHQRPGNDDHAVAMGMDISGNVCLAGSTDNGATSDLLAVKYDNDGNIVGGTLFNGAANDDEDVYDVAVNSLGEQFISGYTTNAAGNADYLLVMCMGDALQAPTPLDVTPFYTSVDLSWTDNSTDEDGFYVQRKLDGCSSGNSWAPLPTAAADAVSYTDDSLNKSTAYCYRVRTFKNTGEVSDWLEIETTTIEPPAPSSFNATAANTTQIDLTWADNTSGEDGFEVERCQGAGCNFSTKTIIFAGANTTSYNDLSVCESTPYSYRILAEKVGDWQSVFSAVDADNTTLSMTAPTGLAAARVSEREISLSWNDNTTDESGFTIERCAGSCDFSTKTTIPVGADTTSYNDTNLDPDTLYRYRIKASKTADCPWTTPWDTVAEATTSLLTPIGLSATPINTTRIDLAWTDNSASESGFEAQRCNSATWSCGATPNATFSVSADVTTYSDTSVAENTDYTYRIMAQRTTAPTWGPVYSTVDSAKTAGTSAPTGMGALRVSEESIALSWTDTTGDETGFYIERCTGGTCPGSGFAQIGSVGSGVVSYTDSKLTPDTTYWYQVRAYKTATSGWTSGYTVPVASATTTLNAPDTLTAVTNNTTRINLAWNDNTTNETGFSVERCEVSACSFGEIAITGADETSYNDETACNNTAYRYQVKAVDTGLSRGGGGCWTAMRPLSITSFTANVIVKFTVFYDGIAPAMQNDFADLRFYDQTAEQELSYWIESKSDGVSAVVWMKTGANNDINMYYGNASASSFSNQDALLEFYDTFPGTTLNTAKWVEIDPNNQLNVNNGLNLAYVDTAWNAALISNQTFTRAANKTFYARINSQDGATSDYSMMGWELNQTGNASYNQLVHGIYWNNTHLRTYQKGSDKSYLTYFGYSRSNVDYEVKVVLKASGATYYARQGTTAGWVKFQERTDLTDAPMRIAVTQKSDKSRIDFIGVLKYDLAASSVAPAGKLTDACYAFANPWASGYSNTDEDTTQTPVGPTLLAAAAVSESQINLTWADNDTDETGYKIERCETTGPCVYTEIESSLPADTVSYSDTGLTQSVSYNYKVTAFKTADCGWSLVAGPVTEPTMSPPPPTDTAVVATNTSQIGLSWTDNTGSNTDFVIERCATTDCDFSTITDFTVGGNDIAYADTSTCPDTEYNYRIKAINGIIWSTTYDTATPANITTVAVALPTGFTATSISETEVDLAWIDNTTDEDGYKIERCNDSSWTCGGTPHASFQVAADVTTYSDTLLTPATDYTYRIYPYKTGSCPWVNYNVVDSAFTTIQAPTGLTTSSVNTTRIDLTWTDTTSSEEGFRLERCNSATWTCGATPDAFDTVGPDVTTYADTTGAHSTDYTYRVKATSTTPLWSSGWSNDKAVTTSTPAAPTVLTATRVSETEIGLSWTDNTGDETGFKVERCEGSGCSVFTEVIPPAASDATSYQDTGLDFNITYNYRIWAYKTATQSWDTGYSNQSEATTTVVEPSSLTAIQANTTQIDLAWTDNTVSETKFEIDRCDGSGCDFSTKTTFDVAANATTYSDTSVCNATGTYNYRVRAVKDADWNSLYSNDAEDTLPTVNAPSGLTVISTAQDTLELSWSDNTSDETGFKIERSEGDCFSFGAATLVAADATSYTDNTSVNPSTTYCYRVRATKAASCPWDSANSASANDLTIQAAATGLTATALNSMKIKLDWTDNSSDEDRYEVYQKLWNGNYVLMDTLLADSTTYTKTFGIDPEKEYFFKVLAVRGADLSSFSNEASDTTPAFVEGDSNCP